MIAKASIVKGSLVGAKYKELEEKDAVFLFQNEMNGNNWQERFFELQQVSKLYSGTRLEKPFIENVISPSPEIGNRLSVGELTDLAKDYAEKMGFSENQWYAVAHQNTDNRHIHLIVNRVNFGGKCSILGNRIGEKSGKVAEQICRERGWKTAQECVADKKKQIEIALLSVIGNSENWREAKEKMKSKGYELELSYKSDNSLNGARIIPLNEIKSSPSEIEKHSKKGFKLSEISRKIKIKDLDAQLHKNHQQRIEEQEEPKFRIRR